MEIIFLTTSWDCKKLSWYFGRYFVNHEPLHKCGLFLLRSEVFLPISVLFLTVYLSSPSGFPYPLMAPISPHCLLLAEKNAQHENCELSFIWGKMRTIAREMAFQIALRNRSKELGGKGQYICDFGKGGIHAIKHIFFCRRFLLVTRSRRHHEGF